MPPDWTATVSDGAQSASEQWYVVGGGNEKNYFLSFFSHTTGQKLSVGLLALDWPWTAVGLCVPVPIVHTIV